MKYFEYHHKEQAVQCILKAESQETDHDSGDREKVLSNR